MNERDSRIEKYLDDLERIIEECDREYAELNHEPSREPRLGN